MTAHARLAAAGTLCLLATLLTATGAAAYPAPGRTDRLVPATGEPDAEMSIDRPAVSDDGRFVAFSSRAANLVPGDDNDLFDVFVFDRQTRQVELISAEPDGDPAGSSAGLAMSGDGRFVAFVSDSEDLVPEDANGTYDVFVRDRQTGRTELASVAEDGTQTDWGSLYPALSADGRHVAFTSHATTLVPDDANGTDGDIFVRDRQTGTVELVSVSSEEAQGNDQSLMPAISDDGRMVAFESWATNLVPNDLNGAFEARQGRDIFVRDREEGTTVRATVANDGRGANGLSQFADISGDGRHVVFRSWATNLVPQDRDFSLDVFTHDLATRRTERISVSTTGGEGDGGTLANAVYAMPSISGDGRYVAFANESTDLVPGDENANYDVFVRDRLLGTTELVSATPEGVPGAGWASHPVISPDGRWVAFPSSAPDLAAPDDNGLGDLFVRDRGPALGAGELTARRDGSAVEVEGWARFPGEVLATATDPADDAETAAEVAGMELIGASLTVRPEAEDVLARIEVAGLPGVRGTEAWGYPSFGGFVACPSCFPPAVAGAPGVVYGIAMEAGDGLRFEARATRVTDEQPSAEASFTLHRCDPGCERIDRIAGAYGTTGDELLLAIPLELLTGRDLTAVHAFAGVGDPEGGTGGPADEVELPDAAVPAPRVEVGAAPDGASPSSYEPASLSDGRFEGRIPDAPSPAHVWVRACLGTCGPPARGPTV